MIHNRILFVLTLACVAVPNAAMGQSANSAIAETLFRDGQRLRREGKFDEACPKLAESYRLDPATGSLLALALCLEGQGRLASAWSTYLDSAARARREGDSTRAEAAESRAADLEARLSKLTVEVSAEAAGLQGLEVSRDGSVLPQAGWSAAVPTDGGEHVVEARAPGHEPWRQSVTIKPEGDAQTIVVPGLALVPTPSAASAPAVPRPTPRGAGAHPADAGETRTGLQLYEKVAIGLGAAGIIGVGVGSFYGLRALGRKSDAEAVGCDNGTCPPGSGGAKITDEGRTAGNISTIAFAAGGVMLGGAAAVYFMGKRSSDLASDPMVRVIPGYAQLVVDGRF